MPTNPRSTTPRRAAQVEKPAAAMRPASIPKPNPIDGNGDGALDDDMLDDALDVTLAAATDRALAGGEELDELDADPEAVVTLAEPDAAVDLVLPDDRDPLAPRSIDDLEVGEDDQMPDPVVTVLRIRQQGRQGVVIIRLTHRAGCPARRERVESFPVLTPKNNRAVTVRCCDCAAQKSQRIA